MNSTQTDADQVLEVPVEALVAISVYAALADGTKAGEERDEIRRVAANLSSEAAGPVIQNVLMGRLSLKQAVEAIKDPAHRLLAYEIALGVCETDGELHPSETEFLKHLRGDLGLDAGTVLPVENQVAEVALAPAVTPDETGLQTPLPPSNSGMVLKYSILNGALELLPQTLSTMAILPLQVKMVYRIGKSHGIDLDGNHIKELIAAMGAGLASQVVEGFARKLAGGLFKKAVGKFAGKVANQTTGSLFSFGSTYAIGMAADKYYAGGRKLRADELRSLFQNLSEQGKGMYEKYRPQIEEKSRTLDPTSVFALLKQKEP